MEQRSTQQAGSVNYQGRPLVRPEEEIVDQGLGFDIGTVLTRRRMFRALGLGAAAVGLAACGDGPATATTSTAASVSTSTSASSGEIPEETAGPYPGDGSNGPDVLEQSGIVRSDIRSSFGDANGTAAGVAMNLELKIADLAKGGVPFAAVAVYVWHCNSAGEYSMYSRGTEDQNYLRGVQVADANGIVRFTSIFPACYSGRWPHIHFEVYPDEAGFTDAGNAIATSQVGLPQDVCDVVFQQAGYEASVRNLAQVTLQTDNVFKDDSGPSQLATVTGDVSKGYSVFLAVGVDTTTKTRGGVGGGAPSGGSGGPPPSAGGPGGTPPNGGPGGAPPNGRGPGGTPPTGGVPSGAPQSGASSSG